MIGYVFLNESECATTKAAVLQRTETESESGEIPSSYI